MKIFIGMWKLLPLSSQTKDITVMNIHEVREEIMRERRYLPDADGPVRLKKIVGEHTPASFEKLFNDDVRDVITSGRFWIRIFGGKTHEEPVRDPGEPQRRRHTA